MRPSTIFRVLGAAAVFLGVGAWMPAWAQAPFPSKPMRLVVAFPPGGTTDVIGRLVAAKLTERLGQQVMIDNRPGAGGMIGSDAVAKAEPDGHTLLFATSAFATYQALFTKVPFSPEKDFAPIGYVASTPYVMVAHPSLPVTSVAELVQYAKARPGQISYAASAPGGSQHLTWELFKRRTSTDLLYVPYKGTGALMPDLLAGRLQAGVDNVAVLTPYIRTGALRPLAVTGASRSQLLPTVPTMEESGIADFHVVGWFGVYAPAKTPAAPRQKLEGTLREVMAQPDVRSRIAELGGSPESGSAESLRALLASETPLWTKVIHDIGIKLE